MVFRIRKAFKEETATLVRVDTSAGWFALALMSIPFGLMLLTLGVAG